MHDDPPGTEKTAMPPSGGAGLGDAETIGSDGTGTQGESRLRARIDAQLCGGESVTIGRFEVLGMLGTGGMSVVCRARDPDLDREVAIKLLQGHAALGDQGRARLQREARAMAKLAHPNVATVFEVGVHEGEVFVAMELVPGQTLRAWRDAHASDPGAIMAMYVAAGQGLAAAHAAGFVHRDFKPENVIVSEDGRARVLDFGVAAVLGESIARHTEVTEGDRQGTLTLTGAVLGTPAYMAPEQHRGGTVDARTDQFAFCVALWEALVGERPFAGATLYEVAAAVCFGTITPPSRPLPGRVETVLRRGFAVAPSERYSSMRELLDALADATRPRRVPKWITAAAISAVLGVGVAVAVIANQDSTDPTATAVRGAPSLAPVEPPAPEEPPAPAEIVELTRTPGVGIDPAPLFMDRDARRVVYRIGGELWLRNVEGERPEPLAWRHPELVPIAFDQGGSGYIGDDDRWLYRVRPGAAPQRLAFAPRPELAISRVAPDQTAVLLYEHERSSLQRAGAEPTTVLAGQDVAFASWSADGQRIAAVIRPSDGPTAKLVVLDAQGNLLHERVLYDRPSNGLVWLGDTIAMVFAGSPPVELTCYAVGEDGIAAPVDRQLDLPHGVGAVVQQGTAGGDLLLLTLRTVRDVAVLVLADDEAPKLLSPDLQANNRLPVWVDDEHLAYVSDRFASEGAVMTDHRAGGHARPDARFAGHAVACAVAGAAMLCVLEDAEVEESIVRVDDERPARRLGPAPGLQAIECADASTCIGLVVPDEGDAEIHAIDPERGTLTRRFTCPRELNCAPERIAIARDGRSILFVDGQRVHRLDAITGDAVAPPLVAGDGEANVQSASELPDGDILVTDIVTQGERSVYRVVRFHEGVGRPIVQSEERWVIRPRVSPDGRHLALTSMEFHHEAAIAKDPCGVAPP